MADAQPVYRRRQFLVDRPYQLRFVTRLFVILFMIAMASALIAMAILWKNMYRPELERQTYSVAAFLGMAVILLIELLVAIPIVYYLGIRQSHQVVGPLNRMKKAVEAIGQGDFSPRLILRRGDVLIDLAQTINRMAENLQKRYPKSPPS
jgi:nitrogen fixation/metabolism regulation signal transduction histidine kinase